MNPLDDKVEFHGNSPTESGRPIRLGGSTLGTRPHICAFFANPDDEYRVLLPFIKEGLECGEKAFHVVDPQQRKQHIQKLASVGIDVTATRLSGQLEIQDWSETHLRDGQFDQDKTLTRFMEVVKNAGEQGFPLIRFVTHMEWALENKPGVDDLLEYEAKANDIWLRHDGPVNPVIGIYDLTKFSGALVIDIMRTHPMIIIGGVLQENPFFVPPDEFLRQLREPSAAQTS